MDLGYVRVCACSPKIKVGDTVYNAGEIIKEIENAEKQGVNVLVFPELSITGATLGDLFYQKPLLNGAEKALKDIAQSTAGKNLIAFVGLPLEKDGLIYNVCAGISDGVILGIVPKKDNDGVFATDEKQLSYYYLDSLEGDEVNAVLFGSDIIFADATVSAFKIAVEFTSESCGVFPPSSKLAVAGARIIVNPCAIEEYSGSSENATSQIIANSKNAVCAYVSANAGEGESTTDYVFSGHDVICENGKVLLENKPFEHNAIIEDIDLESLDFERAKKFNKELGALEITCHLVGFSVDIEGLKSERKYERLPFIKVGEEERLISIQANGLKKRIEHTHANNAVLGLSGGLDSTLALIVAVKTMKLLNRPAKDILAITMPCFGTSSRTLENSIKLAKAYGVTLKKIDITKSVKRHLKDIKHLETIHDAAYENAQARERTQVLMDIANMCNGLVIGTGDLSELALGWATYNGDHMSMYAVNASVPKTLARRLVEYTAENSKGKLKSVLCDILDTPVSPELIPSSDDTIKQVTEDIVGPYILHDYFLYSMIKRGFSPKKIYYTAINTFKGEFDKETILKWLKIFVRRFFNQQFKRSCLPDGVKVTEISLSPRGGWKMPSDALATLWLNELENL